jgi:hypothetical protein
MLLFCTKTVRLNLGLPSISSSSWLAVPIHDVPACRSLAGQYLTNGEIFSGEVVVAARSDSLSRASHQLPFDGCVPLGTMVSRRPCPDSAEVVGDSLLPGGDAGVTSMPARTVLSLTEVWILGVVREWLAAYENAQLMVARLCEEKLIC